MYRNSPKLPHWQGAPSPTYHRRSQVSRRYRILIIIAICILVWHRYARSSSLGDLEIEESIATSYPQEREKLIPKAMVESRSNDEDLTNISPLVQEAHEEEAHSAPEKVPLGMSTEKEQRNEEPEDDEAPERVGSRPRRTSDGSQRVIENAPPASVREASEKLVEQHLSPAVKSNSDLEKTIKASPVQGTPPRFPAYSNYAELDEKADALPDIIHIPFEDSTADVVLEGWEDLWFSEAELNVEKYGRITEPKIDFVYTCKASLLVKF
jgi:hypothetical protein